MGAKMGTWILYVDVECHVDLWGMKSAVCLCFQKLLLAEGKIDDYSMTFQDLKVC